MKRGEKYLVITSLLVLYIIAMFIGTAYAEFRKAQVCTYHYYILLASVITAPLAFLSIAFARNSLWYYPILMTPLFIVIFDTFSALNTVSEKAQFTFVDTMFTYVFAIVFMPLLAAIYRLDTSGERS